MLRASTIGRGLAAVRRRLAREQDGLSIIEVMVAAVLLVLGGLAVFQLVDAAARSSYRAEQTQVTTNLLQRELEHMKSLPRDEIATDYSTCDEWPADFADEYALLTPVQKEDGVPGCSEIEASSASDVDAFVFRRVFWYDPDISSCEEPLTPSDYSSEGYCGLKRIVIGVMPKDSASGGTRAVREIQGDVIGFEAEGEDSP